MNIWEIILRFIEALLSWPVAGLTFGLIFLFKFSDPIRDFLENARLRKVGPVEFEKQREGDVSSEKIEKEENQVEELEKEIKRREENIRTKDEDIKNKDELIEGQRSLISTLNSLNESNEFAYLNLFFVEDTKKVLKWFYDSTVTNKFPISKDYYNIAWEKALPTPLQKEAIFGILLNSEMISLQDASYVATDKGERFLKFIKRI